MTRKEELKRGGIRPYGIFLIRIKAMKVELKGGAVEHKIRFLHPLGLLTIITQILITLFLAPFSGHRLQDSLQDAVKDTKLW